MLQQIPLENPFGTPIYHIDETTSTMDEARRLTDATISTAPILAAEPVTDHSAPAVHSPYPPAGIGIHGSVIVADYQQAGRGRAAGRTWHAAPGESLLCTLILYYPKIQDIPAALPLRLGVAVALTLEALWPQLRSRTRLKWPNDVLIDGKKVCGILCEGTSPWVYAGMGINLLQQDFPPELRHRSISIFQALGAAETNKQDIDRYRLLINLLKYIWAFLNDTASWLTELEQRLYKRGEMIRFLAGSADAPVEVTGILEGVSSSGELLIRAEGERTSWPYSTGELDVYGE
ncbi:biotin--[acetyl-CoA-carboxylase] ligase [Gracilinema caldarium]|uniref:Biotin/acetyl-CoA-carboxylase ligase n=1 Tax=Gracilinema caldarium (strain ATCC 51460 / DSM 7334 / H1) TaxID=744872 RepID=F8F178_GRAC1|nr:biotin--[acetyl-CoA-carboxylase] ligase [Gracilinema caldarium]AEJ18722.1 biotin/acetyl-CoA-carboxylase ligase [Gracilinema caldarium DSM 7334]